MPSKGGALLPSTQAADAARSGGASLKTLTLAPHIRAKGATHKLCAETLKRAPPCGNLPPRSPLRTGARALQPRQYAAAVRSPSCRRALPAQGTRSPRLSGGAGGAQTTPC